MNPFINSFALLILLVLLIECKSSKIESINIGMKLPKKIVLSEKGDILTSSSSFQKAYFIKLNEIEYYICLDSDHRISYVATEYPHFLTEEGIRIGQSLNDPLITTRNEIFIEPGYAYILPLKSGWFAEFSISDYDRGTMSPDSTIKLFFKRRGLHR